MSETTFGQTAAIRPVTSPTDELFAEFGKQVAAILGTSRNWDDVAFGSIQQMFCRVEVGGAKDDDKGRLKLWQGLADLAGVDYEDYDPDTDENDDEEYATW